MKQKNIKNAKWFGLGTGSLQQVPPEDLQEEILSNAPEVDPESNKTSGKNKFKEKDEKPSFGARPDTKSLAFDFKKELE